MNQEKINAAVEKYHNTVDDTFKAGVSYAAANPDVIDCVKVEDAMALSRFMFEVYYPDGDVWRDDSGYVYTDEEIMHRFQIYQQQKQQG